MQTTDLLDLDLTPQSVNLTLNKEPYVLREASGEAACKYRNAIVAGTRLGPDGRPSSLVGIAETEPLLVSLCLFKVTPGADGTPAEAPVPLQVIKSWPSSVVAKLYERAHKMSGLDGEETEADLTKQITEAQTKLDALKAGKESESSPKN